MGLQSKLTAAMTGLHAKIYRASGGKIAAEMKGAPMVVLTTTGNKSGKKRDRPLMKIEHAGHVHVVASNAGQDHDPAWFLNVLADPEVHVVDGAQEYDARAVVLEGADRDAVYEAAKAQVDNFVGYERKAARTIPVVRLERR